MIGSASAMLRILHCRTSDLAEREALAAWDDILFVRKTIEHAVAEGDRMRLEFTAALRGLEWRRCSSPQDAVLDRQAKVDAERAEESGAWPVEGEVAARVFAVEVAERRRGASTSRRPLNGTWLERGIAGSGLGSVLDQLSELSKAIRMPDCHAWSQQRKTSSRLRPLAGLVHINWGAMIPRSAHALNRRCRIGTDCR